MDKLSFSLPAFEGPLDLLLFLISKNKIDIMDIPISELLAQYMQYIDAMRNADLDIASEFLEMASRLVYIKSAMLLPKHEETEDPRNELAVALIEYSTCRRIAEQFRSMTDGLNVYVRDPMPIEIDHTYNCKHHRREILSAYLAATKRAQRKLPPPATAFSGIVTHRIVSVTSKIIFVLKNLTKNKYLQINQLFSAANDRSELVATFLALLELIKAKRVEVNDEDETVSMKQSGGKYGN